MKGNRFAIVLGVIVVGAIIGFFALKGTYPPKSGTEGAIGAANRYQAEQFGAGDVTLKDPEVQAFLQSDLFHQLATNADFRACVQDAGFSKISEFLTSRVGDNLYAMDAAIMQLDAATQQIDAARQLDAYKQKADAARQIDAAAQKIDAAKQELDAAKVKLEAAYQIDAAAQKVDAATQKVDAATQKVDAATQRMEAARQIDAAAQKIDAAKQELDAAHQISDQALARQLDGLSSKMDAAKSQIDALKSMVDGAHQMDAAYKMDAAHQMDAASFMIDGLSVISDNAVAQKLDAGQVQALLSSDFAHLMSDKAYQSLLSSEAFRDAAGAGKLDALSGKIGDQWKQFVGSPEQQRLIDSGDAWKRLVSSDQFGAMMTDFARNPRTDGAGRVIALVTSDNFASMVGPDYAKLAMDPAVLKLAASDQFKSLISNARFIDALKSAEFDQLIASRVDLAHVISAE